MARKKPDPADAVAALLDSVAQEAPKRRGRPPGSKNKPKVAPEAAKPTAVRPRRKAARKAAPKKAAPRKAAPRKAAPRKAAPRKAAPRKAAAPAAQAATPTRPAVRRRRRARRAQTLEAQIGALIADLNRLRAEVTKLERFRSILNTIKD